MTDEAHGDTPEQAPAPPTSTRWSEDAVPEDDAPPPPFVPGRGGPPAEATPGAEPATVEGTSAGGGEPTAAQPFPFELPVDAEEPEAADEQEAAVEAAAAEELVAADTAEDDFPFEQFDIEGRGEEREEVPTPEPESELEPDRDSPAVPVHAAPPTPPAGNAVEEAAALLDRLADKLRAEGEAGLRRELDAPDRLTAVVAGILAGYLSGRS